jgi:hypothetical protein
MAGKYPQIEQLRELRYSISKLRLHDLSVGLDGRNRASLWAYGTKTARNAPGSSQYIFGPAKWIRHLITPPPGRVLVHRDYCQQEVRIAAVLSGDTALLQACESGDVYLGIAGQLGFLSESMNKEERKAVRALFKTVVLGIQYGLGAPSLAVRAGISLFEAQEILARLRAFLTMPDYALKSARRSAGTCNARPPSTRARCGIFRSNPPAVKFYTSPASSPSAAGSSWWRRSMTRCWQKGR